MKLKRTSKIKVLLLLSSVIFLAPLLSGCIGATVHGWAGIAISNNSLYIPTIKGTLVGLDASDRSRLFNDFTLETPASGGFLGCAAAPATSFIYGTPVISVDLDKVFIAGYNGKIYAVSASKGILQWVYPREGALTSFVGGLTLYQDTLYLGGNDGKVYAFDANTGDPVWATPFETRDKVWATPVISDDTIYIGSFDKNLYALNLDGSEKWRFETGGAIINTPIINNGIVYFGSFDRYFYALNAQNGDLLWQSASNAGNWFWADPLLENSVIFAPNIDGNVYIYNTENGNIENVVDLSQQIVSTPVLVGNKLIVASDDGKSNSELWVIDTSSYAAHLIIDLKKLIYAPLSAKGNVVYFRTQDDLVYALNADTEVILWTQPVGS